MRIELTRRISIPRRTEQQEISVDYLIEGAGLGAILAIVGFIATELTRQRPDSTPAWLSHTGMIVMISGVAVWAITLVAMVADLDEETATKVVSATAVVGILGSILVGYLQHRQLSTVPSFDTDPGEDRSPKIERDTQLETAFEPMSLTEAGLVHPDEEPTASSAEEEAVPVGDAGIVAEAAEEPESAEVWLQTWGAVKPDSSDSDCLSADDRSALGAVEDDTVPSDPSQWRTQPAPTEVHGAKADVADDPYPLENDIEESGAGFQSSILSDLDSVEEPGRVGEHWKPPRHLEIPALMEHAGSESTLTAKEAAARPDEEDQSESEDARTLTQNEKESLR